MSTKRSTVQGYFQPVQQFGPVTLESRRAEFRKLIGEVARSLRCVAVTKRERGVCDETARGAALSIDGLEILCELASRSENPMVLEEAIRAAVLKRALNPTPACVFEASESEERANGPLNEAQLLLARERSAVRAVHVAELAVQQLQKTRVLVDAAWTYAAKVVS